MTTTTKKGDKKEEGNFLVFLCTFLLGIALVLSIGVTIGVYYERDTQRIEAGQAWVQEHKNVNSRASYFNAPNVKPEVIRGEHGDYTAACVGEKYRLHPSAAEQLRRAMRREGVSTNGLGEVWIRPATDAAGEKKNEKAAAEIETMFSEPEKFVLPQGHALCQEVRTPGGER